MICGGCGNQDATFVRTKFSDDLNAKFERCNSCAGSTSPSYNRDAAGNRVLYPKDGQSFYSYAADRVFTGQRDMANYLRSNNKIQKG